MFDVEHGISLLTMQGNQVSSPGKGKSHGFSQIAVGAWDIFSCYDGDGPSKLVFVQRRQHSFLVSKDTSGFSSKRGRATRMPLKVSRDTQGPFPVATAILGFLSIFNQSQASSPFEALNSAFLLRCQRDVRPPVEMRPGTRASSRVSTGDSDIPSSCEMKDQPAFKSLQGNPSLLQLERTLCTLNHLEMSANSLASPRE